MSATAEHERMTDDGCPHDGRRRHHRRPAAARFWVWHRVGYVRLTLRPGEELRTFDGGPTDEGYRAESVTYTHTGDGIGQEWATWGRDCDGRHENGGAAFCPLAALAGRDMTDATNGASEARGIFCPEWQDEGDDWRRDYTAEAAGY